ncbi:MAG: hypothetical protein HY314_16680 [Acidobacteria bacterium]|nr:hypothetical protein [Acidobacteriota bacterium]
MTLFAVIVACVEGFFYSRIAPSTDTFRFPFLNYEMPQSHLFFFWGFVLVMCLFILGFIGFEACATILRGSKSGTLRREISKLQKRHERYARAVKQSQEALNEAKTTTDGADKILQGPAVNGESLRQELDRVWKQVEAIKGAAPEWAKDKEAALTRTEVHQLAQTGGLWLTLALVGVVVMTKTGLNSFEAFYPELASRYWTPPLKTVWTQIQASSITAEPLCKLETVQKLVKSASDVGTREEIEKALSKCVDRVIKASEDKRKLGDYTDISGAVAMASDIASGEYGERVLVMLSDFHEDLPRGMRQAVFQLKGERVVLLHRPGTDEPQNISGYLARVDGWKKKLLEHGARVVVSMPVFAVSETRLRAALRPQDVEAGTALTVLVDFKENVLPAQAGGSGDGSLLVQIGRTLAELARDWPSPVTALWMAVGPSGFVSKTLPPLEFGPSLIKKEHALSTVEEFARAMEELACALPSRGKWTSATDISGSLALACSVEPPAKSQVLVVISDFVDGGPQPPAPFRLSPGTRVVMVHKASPADGLDPNAFAARRQAWEQRFRQSGAAAVYQFPLQTFTSNDLRSCLSEGK